jgi:hypothetical protein
MSFYCQAGGGSRPPLLPACPAGAVTCKWLYSGEQWQGGTLLHSLLGAGELSALRCD